MKTICLDRCIRMGESIKEIDLIAEAMKKLFEVFNFF